jgi:hypothetical protein
MSTEEELLEKWFARTIESYSGETLRFLTSEKDQFRNPVGFTLRENLAVLLQEILGAMDAARVNSALQAIIRLRAVQNLTVAQGVGFVFLLRPLVDESATGLESALINTRIDHLALIAFEEYMRCREHLSEIRLNESRREMAVPAALQRARG